MSVDINTTFKTWLDVPEKHKKQLSNVIQEIQTELLSHFGVCDAWDDENDCGYFPEIDIEVHDVNDPEGTTQRLVIEPHATSADQLHLNPLERKILVQALYQWENDDTLEPVFKGEPAFEKQGDFTALVQKLSKEDNQ